jgi:hypothetical protein
VPVQRHYAVLHRDLDEARRIGRRAAYDVDVIIRVHPHLVGEWTIVLNHGIADMIAHNGVAHGLSRLHAQPVDDP